MLYYEVAVRLLFNLSCCTGSPMCRKVWELKARPLSVELKSLGRTYVMMGCVLYFFAIIVMPACALSRGPESASPRGHVVPYGFETGTFGIMR